MPFLDSDALRDFPPALFGQRKPFPFYNFPALLTPEGFAALYKGFPPLSLFDKHKGLERPHGQRPHDRYYLAYENSIYDPMTAGGSVVQHSDLPAPWQAFMEELRTSEEYHAFIGRLLGPGPFVTRYAWHVGIRGSEVSPHRDSENKAGTHIFYFNTADDWDMNWGGATLALAGKKVGNLNPDFSDFESEMGGEIRDNHSFLFRNEPEAWHGVRTLTCPDGAYRRLFNVIMQTPPEKKRSPLHKFAQSLFGGGKRS